MPLKFLDNAVASGMCPSPDTKYRELNQAFICQQWENTTALRKDLKEQDVSETNTFEGFTFHNVEAWLNYVVGQTSSGTKNGDDFVELAFKSLEHPCIKGRYYQFDNNYWLAYFTNEYDSVKESLAVRRCNNFLKIIDPESGELYSIPCVVGYDMSAPSTQVSRYVITPNNHATVMVQGNPMTTRLFKLNTRFILSGRPFKLYGQQNAIYDDLLNPDPTILYLDLFLDEVHAGDDLENGIADNGEYNYAVSINSDSMELPKDTTGKLTADVTLNGKEVSRNVLWSSSSKAVEINDNGEYKVLGTVGNKSVIRATLEGNNNVIDEITITVADAPSSEAIIMLDPNFEKIREYETVKVNLVAVYNGVEYTDTITSNISLSPDSIVYHSENLSIDKVDNQYALTCEKFTNEPINLYLSVENNTPAFAVKSIKQIKLVNMFG